jgi:hypothetical protein
VTAVAEALSDMMKDAVEIRTTLKVALFLADKYIANPKSHSQDYTSAVKAMVMRELGIGQVN